MIRFFLFLLASFTGVLATAQTLEQDLQAIATQYGLVGMSVVATCSDDVVQVAHTGQRNIAMALSVNDATRYRIASISKLVTAMGLMKLWEQGNFELDDDVSGAMGYLLRSPSFPSIPITYRMLLSHRSGMQDGTGYGPFLTATYGATVPPPIQQLVTPGGTWYTTNIWRTEQPGTWFAYSNLNYGIIASLIEAHSNLRFDQYMREEILLPMGIEGSYNIQDLDEIGELATLYRNSVPQADDHNGTMPPAPDLSGYINGSNGLYFAPQGGLRASALELANILRTISGEGTFEGAQVLEPATMAAMLANEWTWNGNNGDNYYGLFRSWGLGVHRITAQNNGDMVLPGTFMVGHAGEAYGLISDLYLDPETGFGLVFLTNGYSGSSNYQLGTSSAFYRVEEEVFAALGVHSFAACGSTNVTERRATDQLIVREREVEWRG